MDNKIKNYLGFAIMIGVIAFSIAMLSYVRSYSRSIEPSTFRSFSVSGEGKVVAIPDIAQFNFSVITQSGRDIAVLQRENTDKVNAIIDFVKSKNIEAKDIKTQNYNLDPRYQFFTCPFESRETKPCPPPEIVGYTINQTVSIKIRDFSKIGDILAGVVEKGANNVSQLSFEIDEPTKVQNEAREEAIKKAKEKANLIARAGGFKVGRLLSINEGFGPIPMREQFLALEAKGSEGPAPLPAPTIEPGSQEVSVSVNLVYEIR